MTIVLRKHTPLLSALGDKNPLRIQIPCLLTLFLFISGCMYPSEKNPVRSAVEILADSQYWVFVNAECFTDGGSLVYSFLNGKGEVIHVREDNSFAGRKHDRVYYLMIKYSDPARTEIKHGSSLETQVLEMIYKCSRKDSFPKPPHTIKSACDDLSARLKDRKRSEENLEGK